MLLKCSALRVKSCWQRVLFCSMGQETCAVSLCLPVFWEISRKQMLEAEIQRLGRSVFKEYVKPRPISIPISISNYLPWNRNQLSHVACASIPFGPSIPHPRAAEERKLKDPAPAINSPLFSSLMQTTVNQEIRHLHVQKCEPSTNRYRADHPF